MLMRQLQHVPRSRRPRFKSFNRMIQVVRGAGERRQVQYPVDSSSYVDGLADVVFKKLERVFVQQMLYVFEMTGDQVIESDDFMPLLGEAVAEV